MAQLDELDLFAQEDIPESALESRVPLDKLEKVRTRDVFVVVAV